MEWTKIKTKHYLFTDYSLNNLGALSLLLCLTAHLERMPSEKEMIQQVHYKQLKSLQDKINEHSTDLQSVLNKVLEDVQGIEHKKAISRGTTKRYMEKKKAADMSADTTENRREEKRIGEKKKVKKEITHPPFVSLSKEELKVFIVGYGKLVTEKYIVTINDYLSSTGKKPYKDYAATIRNWMRRDNVMPVQKLKPIISPVTNKPMTKEEQDENLKKMEEWKKNSPEWQKLMGSRV